MSKSNYHNGRKRDVCYFCNAQGTEEHHIIPQRFDGPDKSTNIVGVCKPCHKKLERLYDKSFYEWFGIEDEKGERKYHQPCYREECSEKAVMTIRWATNEKDIVCGEHGEWLINDTAAELVEAEDE